MTSHTAKLLLHLLKRNSKVKQFADIGTRGANLNIKKNSDSSFFFMFEDELDELYKMNDSDHCNEPRVG